MPIPKLASRIAWPILVLCACAVLVRTHDALPFRSSFVVTMMGMGMVARLMPGKALASGLVTGVYAFILTIVTEELYPGWLHTWPSAGYVAAVSLLAAGIGRLLAETILRRWAEPKR